MAQLMKARREGENSLRKSSCPLYTSRAHVICRYFAGEIIGNVLDIEPRRWRRPKRVDRGFNKERVEKFQKKYNKFDWTGMIGKL